MTGCRMQRRRIRGANLSEVKAVRPGRGGSAPVSRARAALTYGGQLCYDMGSARLTDLLGRLCARRYAVCPPLRRQFFLEKAARILKLI